jgi:hypothetical protein
MIVPRTRKLDIGVRRALILIALIVTLTCWANQLLGWGFFGGADEEVSNASFVVLAVALYLFWTTPDEIHAYRAAKRRPK